MAVIEQQTDNYYKINIDRCCVSNGTVVVSVDIYNTKQDRDNEKERVAKQALFFDNFVAKLNEYQNVLISDYTEELEDKYVNLDMIYSFIKHRVTSLQQTTADLSFIDDDVMQEIIELGFEEDWVIQPVVKISDAMVYCGQSDSDNLSPSDYYFHIKQRISKPIEDI